MRALRRTIRTQNFNSSRTFQPRLGLNYNIEPFAVLDFSHVYILTVVGARDAAMRVHSTLRSSIMYIVRGIKSYRIITNFNFPNPCSYDIIHNIIV